MKHIVSVVAGTFTVVAAVAALVIGAAYAGGSLPLLNGDVDCSGSITPVDSLKILRHDAGLSNSQAPGCAPIGDPGSGTPPTSTPTPPTSTPSPSPANEVGPYSGSFTGFTDEFCLSANIVTVEFTTDMETWQSMTLYLKDADSGGSVDTAYIKGDGSTQMLTDGSGCYFVEVFSLGYDWTIWVSW